MAKRKPKLGDVRYRANPKNRKMYILTAFIGGEWVVMAHDSYYLNVEVHKSKLRQVLIDIIREARETNDGKDK